jgi:hypothetical protein
MRVYLPATLPMLREFVTSGALQPIGGRGFAVTADLRAEYPGADTEDLEYVAMHDAALASLRLIAANESEPVRVVLAVDAESIEGAGSDASVVTPRADLDRAAVSLSASIPWDAVASVHLDGGDVAGVIRAAADCVMAADLGDLDAALTVGDAEDIDLGWYAPSEIGYLVTELNMP